MYIFVYINPITFLLVFFFALIYTKSCESSVERTRISSCIVMHNFTTITAQWLANYCVFFKHELKWQSVLITLRMEVLNKSIFKSEWRHLLLAIVPSFINIKRVVSTLYYKTVQRKWKHRRHRRQQVHFVHSAMVRTAALGSMFHSPRSLPHSPTSIALIITSFTHKHTHYS